jgi:hypothetical protein
MVRECALIGCLLSSDAHPPRYRSLSRNPSGSNSPVDPNSSLVDDYAEIVDEDGDYSVPASKKPIINSPTFYD